MYLNTISVVLLAFAFFCHDLLLSLIFLIKPCSMLLFTYVILVRLSRVRYICSYYSYQLYFVVVSETLSLHLEKRKKKREREREREREEKLTRFPINYKALNNILFQFVKNPEFVQIEARMRHIIANQKFMLETWKALNSTWNKFFL